MQFFGCGLDSFLFCFHLFVSLFLHVIFCWQGVAVCVGVYQCVVCGLWCVVCMLSGMCCALCVVYVYVKDAPSVSSLQLLHIWCSKPVSSTRTRRGQAVFFYAPVSACVHVCMIVVLWKCVYVCGLVRGTF